jgi:hypothetical protein
MSIALYRESLYSDQIKNQKVQPGSTVRDFLMSSGNWQLMQELPIVVLCNGIELLERDYDCLIKDADIIELQQYPRAPAVVAFITYVYYAAVIISAVYLLTMEEPGIPEPADVKEGSPTYSISVRGNRYRPGTKGPVLYGTLRLVPDFDQPAFSTYDTNNDQTLHMLFRITQGIADINLSSITFEDTPLSNFHGYQLEVVQPGESPTLFPYGVIESGDLNNLDLQDGYTAAYVANDSGTEITRIGVDFSSPSIALQDKSSGNLNSYTVRFDVEAQLINDSNVAIGSWVVLGNEALSGASADAIRRTFEYPVEAGRYQVRVRRITPNSESQYTRDTVSWAGLKGFLHDPDNVSPNTRLAVSIRSSEQIGNRALSDMSVICSRRLPTWNSEDGWSIAPVATNSIAWALADLCRASYAGNRSDLNYDLPKLAALDAQLTPLGHEFNAYFDSSGITVWDALNRAGTAGRITTIDKMGFYTFVRDEFQSQTVQAFTMRNIARGSFSIEHQGVLEETADSIIVKIQDKDNDYRIREILCSLPDSPALNPRTMDLFGVTDATRAKELGMFMAACNRYRRKLTPFETGIEGRIPFYGSKIAISHFLLGQEGVRQLSGDIIGYDGVDKIQLSEKLEPAAFSDPHIVMIDLDGRPMPAYSVVRISDFVVQVVGDVDWSQIVIEPGYKNPMFMIGDGETYVYESKVNKVTRDGNVVKIESFIDDPRVYIYGDDVIPPPSVVIPAPQSAAPVLSDLQAHVGGTVDDPQVTLSWNLSNADRTDVQYSVDSGLTFLPIGVGWTRNNQFQHNPLPGTYIYRLAAVNLFRGPWVSITVSTLAAEFEPPLPPENLQLREPFTGPYLKLQWESDSRRHLIQVVVSSVIKYTETIEGETWDFHGNLAQDFAVGRAFTVRVYAVGENSKTSLTYASIDVSNPAPAQLDNLAVNALFGQAMITFDWPTDSDIEGVSVWKSNSNGFVPGLANLSVNKSRDPVLKVPVDENEVAYIRVAAVDNWGEAGLNISGQFTVTGKTVDLDPVYDDLAALELALTNLQADVDVAEATLATTVSDLNTAEATLATTVSDLNAAEATLATTVSDLNTAEATLATTVSDLNAAEATLASTVVDLDAAEVRLDLLEASLEDAAQDIADAQDDIDSAEISIASLQGKFPIGTTDISDSAISTPKIAANAVTAEKIIALAITAEKLAALAVTAEKLAALAVTAEKIAANAIIADKIAANAVTTDKLNAEAVTAGKIAALAITAEKLAALAVTAEKIAALAVTAEKIAANAIIADKIAANAVTTDKLNAEAVTAGKIAALAVTVDKLAALSVTAEKIAALAVTTEKIAALAVNADKIASNSISTDKLVALAVTADKIAALAITAGKIAANTITADKMNVAQLSAIAADLGMVTAGTLQTTAGTGPRVVISSSGSYPLWIGNGATVNTANGILYMDTSGNMTFKGKLSVKSATSGERLEVESNHIRVYDASNVLRVEIGELS